MFTTSGISTSSAPIRRPNLPVGSIRTLPFNNPMTSTAMSNVPRTPKSSAVIPLSDCCDDCAVLLLPPPKARVARFTPTPTVKISMPSLKPMSSMPTDGPSSCNGPRLIRVASGAFVAPGADGSIVKLCFRPVMVVVEVSVLNEPSMNSTLTVPALKIRVVATVVSVVVDAGVVDGFSLRK